MIDFKDKKISELRVIQRQLEAAIDEKSNNADYYFTVDDREELWYPVSDLYEDESAGLDFLICEIENCMTQGKNLTLKFNEFEKDELKKDEEPTE
jgi:hypothetical protein